MVSNRAFIFHIYIPWGETLSLVPKSRSSVKVQVRYEVFGKKWPLNGIHVSQIHLVCHQGKFILPQVLSIYFISQELLTNNLLFFFCTTGHIYSKCRQFAPRCLCADQDYICSRVTGGRGTD